MCTVVDEVLVNVHSCTGIDDVLFRRTSGRSVAAVQGYSYAVRCAVWRRESTCTGVASQRRSCSFGRSVTISQKTWMFTKLLLERSAVSPIQGTGVALSRSGGKCLSKGMLVPAVTCVFVIGGPQCYPEAHLPVFISSSECNYRHNLQNFFRNAIPNYC